MLQRLSPTARNATLAVLGVLVLWFAWTVRSVLNPLIFGYFLAYAIHPSVLGLQRKGWSRNAAVNLCFTIAGLAMFVVGTTLFVQGRGLVLELADEEGLPTRMLESLELTLEEHAESIDWVLGFLGDEDVVPDPETEGPPVETASSIDVGKRILDDVGAALGDLKRMLFAESERVVQAGTAVAGRSFSFMRAMFGSLLALLTFLILLPVYAYFLLFELERIHGFVRRYLPRRDREKLVHIGSQIGEVLSNFFRGRLLVCTLKGSILAFGLAVLGVDYAFLVGFSSGFLSLVPFVGPLIGAIAAFLLGLLDHGLVGSIWRVALVFSIAEVIEGYVLIPKVLGDSLGLHPVVVLVSVFVGGAALGMFGFLIALPLTATLVILVRELVLPALKDLAEES